MKRVETAPAATLCGGLSRVSRGPRSRLHRRGKDGRDEQAQACFLVDTFGHAQRATTALRDRHILYSTCIHTVPVCRIAYIPLYTVHLTVTQLTLHKSTSRYNDHDDLHEISDIMMN